MASPIARPEPHCKPLESDQEEDGWLQAIEKLNVNLLSYVELRFKWDVMSGVYRNVYFLGKIRKK